MASAVSSGRSRLLRPLETAGEKFVSLPLSKTVILSTFYSAEWCVLPSLSQFSVCYRNPRSYPKLSSVGHALLLYQLPPVVLDKLLFELCVKVSL